SVWYNSHTRTAFIAPDVRPEPAVRQADLPAAHGANTLDGRKQAAEAGRGAAVGARDGCSLCRQPDDDLEGLHAARGGRGPDASARQADDRLRGARPQGNEVRPSRAAQRAHRAPRRRGRTAPTDYR